MFAHVNSNMESRTVEWPPRSFGSMPDINNPQNQQGPNLTTVYPSVFKMRNEAPLNQTGGQVYSSQPMFHTKRPMRMRGDNKWPPRDYVEANKEQELGPLVKPAIKRKDYSRFFAKNVLPSNYTGYKVPPGTQHVGGEEEEGEEDGTDM